MASLTSLIDPVTPRPYYPNVQPVISAEQMREIDRATIREHELSTSALMLNAALACFDVITSYFADDLAGLKALILCGPGNNGGDGAELAMALYRADVQTDVVLFGRIEKTRGAARTVFEAVNGEVRKAGSASTNQASAPLTFVECDSEEAWEKLKPSATVYDLIVDALFGHRSQPPPRRSVPKGGGVSEHSPTRDREVSATLDCFRGSALRLNADLSQTIGAAVAADITVTFTAAKTANVLPPASDLNGELAVADIGSPDALIEATNPTLFLTEESDARQWLINTRYHAGSFKNTHGHALVIAGSRGYTGAAVLSGNAAMRSGAGLVTIATPASAQASVAASVMPEVMTTALAETDRGAVSDEAIDHALRLAAKADVVAIGPGLSAEDERTRRFVYQVVKQRKGPMVIDADGLNCLVPWPADLQGSDRAPLILTPHPGEMLRLLGTTDKSALEHRVNVAREFATSNQVILVLKGSRSLIAAPDGRVFINPTGNAGLGTAGAGDTLTGIIAGFLSQSAAGFYDEADALFAVIAALYLGGLAGDFAARDLGMRSMVASDIREHLSEAICSLDPEGEIP